MRRLMALVITGFTITATLGPALAADLLLPPPPPLSDPGYVPVDLSGGFYLRGDIGEGNPNIDHMQSTFLNDPGAGIAELGGHLTQDVIAGIGAGYQFNSYFRADVTGEYRFSSKLTSTTSYTNVFCAIGTCYDGYTGSVHTALFLLNGYADLGTWYNVTPYIGVGVGTAINSLSNMTDTAYSVNAFGQANGTDTHANFAYAAMAGFSYSLTRNLKLDFGYRYVDMGRVSSDAIVCNNIAGCHYESQHFHLTSNDVRLGLRYLFTDPGAPLPQAYPVIAKY